MYTKKQQVGKRKQPKAQERNRITPKEYNKAVEAWGDSCFCGNPYTEMHHITYRSKGGRGVFRNLIPLCKIHHEQAHKDDSFRRNLEIQRKRVVGDYYWCDKYDLYNEGLIDEPTENKLERFFAGVNG